jgi:hypothetical protein
LIVAAAYVFGPRPIGLFLSLSGDFLDILYYEMDASPFSFVLFYFAVFLADILMVMLIVLMRLVMVHS